MADPTKPSKPRPKVAKCGALNRNGRVAVRHSWVGAGRCQWCWKLRKDVVK